MMRKNITKKYKVILFVVGLLLIVVSYLGVSYAFKPKEIEEDNSSLVLTIENLSITYFQDEKINLTNFAPKEEYELSFSITNSSGEDIYYSLGFDEVMNTISGEVGLDITSTNNGGEIINGNYPKDASEVIEQVKIGSGVTQRYNLKIVNKSDMVGEIGGEIKITILKNVINEEKETFKSFATILLENSPVVDATTIPGKEVSTTSEGLIKSEDDLGTSYYFRGKVDNNFVSFADLTWRIIRINGDNTVRLILDDILSETTIYNEVKDNYLDSYNFNNSSINLFLNSWYDSKLKNFDDKIVNNIFCNDYEVVDTTGYQEIYNGYKNVNNNIPSLKCQNKINLKIGLINVNEVLLAGNVTNQNSNNYLYNSKIGNGWWTMSPSYKNNNNNELYMYSLNPYTNNLKDNTIITSEKSIRPVINLNKKIMVTGTGTINDPYIII